MRYVVFVIIGLIFGGFSDDGWGVWVGGVIGFLCAWIISLSVRINELENRFRNAEAKRLIAAGSSQAANQPAQQDHVVQPDAEEVSEIPPPASVVGKQVDQLSDDSAMDLVEIDEQPEHELSAIKEEVESDIELVVAEEVNDDSVTESSSSQPDIVDSVVQPVSATAAKVQPAEPSAFEQALDKGFRTIKDWVVGYFTGGNSLVRAGMLVLFVGVAFLLKYVAERTVVPVEVRYVGVVAASLVMLVLGWRLRHKRSGYALSLQGGGVGLLYLTLFAAMRLHQLMPPSIVLICLIGIVVLSAALAVLQDSMALAVIGVVGGFAAPILTSTGSGSHVQLFAYYLLLNLSIFGIAWFKSWRLLNVIGFVATFAIGSLWGYSYYRPEYFSTVEPFLIAHFLLYVVIAVLFAFKQPPKLKGINDGTLIFGTPIVVFALQAGLVKGMVYGLAYSALVLGVFYVLMAYVIKKLHRPFFKDLIESFIALGVGFATLAIPLGFDGRVTSAMWVAEASALVWVGVRQSRVLPRFSGYVLAALGCAAFFVEPPGQGDLLPFLNADFIGVLIVVAATGFIGLYTRGHADRLYSFESTWIPRLMLLSAVVWWLVGSLVELHRHFPEQVYLLQQMWLMITVVGVLALGHRIVDGLLVFYALVINCLMLPLLVLTPTGPVEVVLFNARFLGMLVVALFSLAMSLFWQKYPWPEFSKLINQSLLSRFFLTTGVLIWLVAMTFEIQRWFEFHQLLWMQLMMALTAGGLLWYGHRKQVADFSWAAVFVVLAMILPLYQSLAMHLWFVPTMAEDGLPVMNVVFGSLMIYFAAHFFMSYYWQKHHDVNHHFSHRVVSRSLLILAIASWVLNGWGEIDKFFNMPVLLPMLLVFFTLSVVGFVLIAHRFKWSDLHLVKYAMTPILAYFALNTPLFQAFHEGFGWVAWLLAFVVNYWVIKVYEGQGFKLLLQYHVLSLWILAFVVVQEAAGVTEMWLGLENIWYYASIPAALLLITTVVYVMRDRLQWPLMAHHRAYYRVAVPVMMWVLWLMVVLLNLNDPGSLLGVPYIPVFNAIDAVGLLSILLAVNMHKQDADVFFVRSMKAKYILAAVTGFLMLNASMLRCFHYWYGIDYSFSEMTASFMVQTGFSILWAAAAVTLMVMAAKKRWRQVWLVGLGLMAVVVAKLFLVDMSASGSIERIVAFLSVGFLLSLVGYFSPLPPDVKREKTTGESKAEVNHAE